CSRSATPCPLRRLSFPTRRSSDLVDRIAGVGARVRQASLQLLPGCRIEGAFGDQPQAALFPVLINVQCESRPVPVGWLEPGPPRSEEHTSELQSRVELVCRLLLAK